MLFPIYIVLKHLKFGKIFDLVTTILKIGLNGLNHTLRDLFLYDWLQPLLIQTVSASLELEPKKGKQKLAAKEQKITYFKASERDEQNYFFVELCGKKRERERERERESITIGLSLEDISRGSGFLRSSRRFFFLPPTSPSISLLISLHFQSILRSSHHPVSSNILSDSGKRVFSCLQLYVSSVQQNSSKQIQNKYKTKNNKLLRRKK